MDINGGELVATGSDSCVFIPNFPCKRDGKIDDNRISKIMYGEDAEEDSLEEKRMNEQIKKIKGHSKWAIIFDEFCKPLSKEILMEYDKKGIEDCINDEDSYLYDNFDKNSYMMNGKYGGITLVDYFEDIFFENVKRSKHFNNQFYKLMKKMEPLFLGLKVMNEKGIVHNDIKYNNIVLHNDVFKYIDFGLAGKVSDKEHFEQRSFNEFNTRRIYLFYPLEYLLYYASKKKINEEMENITMGYYRNNFENFDQVNLLFESSGQICYEETIQALFDQKVNEKNMIQSIDVYSLGILIPLMFMYNTKLWKYKNQHSLLLDQILYDNPMVQEFFVLFGRMTEPLSNQRINAKESYLQFKRLLKKYSRKTPTTKKSKKVKKRRVSHRKISTKRKKSKKIKKRKSIGRVNKRRQASL
tara:strand:+ start:12247 stop:13482 length:1236 start_codon:yes stop_codon:yes gene_type:complete